MLNQFNSKSINPMSKSEETFELYSVPSCENNFPEIIKGSEIGSTKQCVEKDDVLLCKINPRINRVWKVSKYTNYSLIASSEWIVFRNKKINSSYIKWYFTSNGFRELLLSSVSGVGGSLMRAQPKYVNEYPIPLPPLAEQQRIANLIESLFEKLDQAKGLIQDALDSFENRKAAILHKAFSGELTKKWREENGVGIESWRIRKFNEVAEIKSNLVDPIKFADFPHIAPDNIEKRTGKLLPYRTIKEDGVTSGKHRFYSGQILYSKIRPYLSKVVLIDFEGLCSADMYPVQAKENSKYLWYYMLSDEFLTQASSAGSRSVLPKINQKELSEISVTIPTVDEQAEIVRILDSVIEKENQIRVLCDSVDDIDSMKKSILARAFRGELGTNDPEEESALDLLRLQFYER